MNSLNLNGKTFQINLYSNYNQSGSILCGDKCVSILFYSKAMCWGIDRKSFSKNPTNFSSTHVGICVKDATPLIQFESQQQLTFPF